MILDVDDYANKLASVAGWGRIGENKPPSDIPRQVSGIFFINTKKYEL